MNPPRRPGSHEADDILPSQPAGTLHTSSPNNPLKTSTRPFLPNSTPSTSQLPSLVESSIPTPSETIQEKEPVDVIRGIYIPDQDLAIVPKWSVRLQHHPRPFLIFQIIRLRN
ncbi:uncharacterized protein N7496_007895 [Penicillium cataractarum]|uniref:Uncharacterized protein n=1 Tax=Penicillium cataractarum TaxID=2100454 RepID=A0A9W9RXK2_9EURO|nr:uncharacterized protein N7496_007895 [Penicillium cataractarum]KAJ5368135.1 hypothetical protein N7496_007895 [Penicillium cataractarum]